MRSWRGAIRQAAVGTVAFWAALTWPGTGGCSRSPQDEPLKRRPALSGAESAPAAESAGPGTQNTAEKPPDQPASRPVASLPASTYDPNPPYPVRIHVASADEEQPGWLRIMQLEEGRPSASATGVFPEQNLVVVDTQNVRRLRIHVGHLPLSAHRRIILRIDGQGMELSRRREFLQLERRPTGEWVVLREPAEPGRSVE